MNRGVLLLSLLALAGRGCARSAASYDQRQEGEVNVQIDVKDVQVIALVDTDALEDYSNYDYAYDYSDFTIKPRPTPSKPSSSTTPAGVSSSSTSKPAAEPTSTPAANVSSTPAADASSTSAASAAASTLAADIEFTSAASPTASSSVPPAAANDSKSTSTTAASLSSSTEPNAEPATIFVAIKGHDEVPAINIATAKPNEKPISEAAVGETSPSSVSNKPTEQAEPRKRCPIGFLLKSGRCFKRRLSFIS